MSLRRAAHFVAVSQSGRNRDLIPMNRLFWQAVLAFLVLPGTVAFVVPLLLIAPAAPGPFIDASGLIPLALGIVLLLWCVRDFYVAGRGTLAHWAPQRELVMTGFYRFSRNPMYIAVVLVLWGWALGFRSRHWRSMLSGSCWHFICVSYSARNRGSPGHTARNGRATRTECRVGFSFTAGSIEVVCRAG